MQNRVLIDYTNLVSANNVLDCRDAIYPGTTRNPYASLLKGRPTESGSPMWLEVASLADVLESIVIHDNVLILDVLRSDRIFEKGRYAQNGASEVSLFRSMKEAQMVTLLDVTGDSHHKCLQWLEAAAQENVFVEALMNSCFELLKQPAYSAIPDLFSHSQTIYKFDGESIWNNFAQNLNLRKFSRQYQRQKELSRYQPQMHYTSHFYAEDILAFLIRGLLYNEVAKVEKVSYHPHPARSLIVMSDGLWSHGVAKNYAEIPINYITNMRSEVAEAKNKDLQQHLYELRIPPVLSSVLRESKEPKDIANVAVQMRNSSSARAFRAWISSIYEAESGLKIVHMAHELEELKKKMKLELGLESETANVGIWLFGFKARIPTWAQKSFYVGPERHLRFLRDLYRSSLDVVSLESHLVRLFAKQ